MPSEPVEVDEQKIQRLTIHYKFIGHWKPLNNGYFLSHLFQLSNRSGADSEFPLNVENIRKCFWGRVFSYGQDKTEKKYDLQKHFRKLKKIVVNIIIIW